MSKHSATQARPLPSSSLLGLALLSARRGKRSSPHSSKPPIRRSRPITGPQLTNNRTLMLRMTRLAAGIHLICLHACDLCKVQRDHIWNLPFETVSERRESSALALLCSRIVSIAETSSYPTLLVLFFSPFLFLSLFGVIKSPRNGLNVRFNGRSARSRGEISATLCRMRAKQAAIPRD